MPRLLNRLLLLSLIVESFPYGIYFGASIVSLQRKGKKPLNFLFVSIWQCNYRLNKGTVLLPYVPFCGFVNSLFEQKLYHIRHIQMVFLQYVSSDEPPISQDLWG